MGENDTRLVIAAIDWGSALAAVNMFLRQDELPSDMSHQQLLVLERFAIAARKRLAEKTNVAHSSALYLESRGRTSTPLVTPGSG